MASSKVPNEWDLSAESRYMRQNMEMAMRGRIERGLVELITNSDDSYRELEEEGKEVSGKIIIEIERRKKGNSVVMVKDRAGGMSREDMYMKLGTLGRRTSGFETGKLRRGLHGRGARDVAAFGIVHFESIKNDYYNHLIIPISLKCRFINEYPIKATQEIRNKLGIPKGNGTVVTIEVNSRFPVPQHESLSKDFRRYFSLRDLFSDIKREVILKDLNKSRIDKLIYRYPEGEIVFDEDITIPNYPMAKAHLKILRHPTAFDVCQLPIREGILIKSSVAIHDCGYFDLDAEPLAWRFSGILKCDYIDTLILDYDNREEANIDNPNHPEDNPLRLLHPTRDGLIREHPFVQQLYRASESRLKRFINELKEVEGLQKHDVTNEDLNKKLQNLSKDISKLFERKLNELNEVGDLGSQEEGYIRKLSVGLHIIPSGEVPLIVDTPKTFSFIVKHYDRLDQRLSVDIISSDPEIIKPREAQVSFKEILDDGKIGRGTFTIEGNEVGKEAIIEVKCAGYSNLLIARVIEPDPEPDVPVGLTFEKPKYHLIFCREKNLQLRLKTDAIISDAINCDVRSNHKEIIIKGGNRFQLKETKKKGIFTANIKVVGRQLKAKGKIEAYIIGLQPAKCDVIVEEREPESGIRLEFEPIEEDFGALRYKWHEGNLYHMFIGGKHPSVRKYLGEYSEDGYPGINSPLYHAVLAEIIAEALAFKILEKQCKREQGNLDYASIDLYYHRNLTDFLKITHKYLAI